MMFSLKLHYCFYHAVELYYILSLLAPTRSLLQPHVLPCAFQKGSRALYQLCFVCFSETEVLPHKPFTEKGSMLKSQSLTHALAKSTAVCAIEKHCNQNLVWG